MSTITSAALSFATVNSCGANPRTLREKLSHEGSWHAVRSIASFVFKWGKPAASSHEDTATFFNRSITKDFIASLEDQQNVTLKDNITSLNAAAVTAGKGNNLYAAVLGKFPEPPAAAAPAAAADKKGTGRKGKTREGKTRAPSQRSSPRAKASKGKTRPSSEASSSTNPHTQEKLKSDIAAALLEFGVEVSDIKGNLVDYEGGTKTIQEIAELPKGTRYSAEILSSIQESIERTAIDLNKYSPDSITAQFGVQERASQAPEESLQSLSSEDQVIRDAYESFIKALPQRLVPLSENRLKQVFDQIEKQTKNGKSVPDIKDNILKNLDRFLFQKKINEIKAVLDNLELIEQVQAAQTQPSSGDDEEIMSPEELVTLKASEKASFREKTSSFIKTFEPSAHFNPKEKMGDRAIVGAFLVACHPDKATGPNKEFSKISVPVLTKMREILVHNQAGIKCKATELMQ